MLVRGSVVVASLVLEGVMGQEPTKQADLGYRLWLLLLFSQNSMVVMACQASDGTSTLLRKSTKYRLQEVTNFNKWRP